jgi:hypothetical protein
MPNNSDKPKNILESLSADQIRSAMASLTPEKVAAIRLAAAQAGIKDDDKFHRLPNGDLKMLVTIPNDLVEPLMTVTEAAGEPPFDYIHGIILQGINAWFIGGIEDEQPAAKPTTTIPVGTSA